MLIESWIEIERKIADAPIVMTATGDNPKRFAIPGVNGMITAENTPKMPKTSHPTAYLKVNFCFLLK
jgi:hypothetical protein